MKPNTCKIKTDKTAPRKLARVSRLRIRRVRHRIVRGAGGGWTSGDGGERSGGRADRRLRGLELREGKRRGIRLVVREGQLAHQTCLSRCTHLRRESCCDARPAARTQRALCAHADATARQDSPDHLIDLRPSGCLCANEYCFSVQYSINRQN